MNLDLLLVLGLLVTCVGLFIVDKPRMDVVALLMIVVLPLTGIVSMSEALAGLGSVMSSTGVVAIFVPVVLAMAERLRVPPGRLMMPLAYAGLISGMLTLVGQPRIWW